MATAEQLDVEVAEEQEEGEREGVEDVEPELGDAVGPEPEGPPGPMAAFDEAAVQAWLAAVPGLAAAQVPPDAHRHRTMLGVLHSTCFCDKIGD